MQYEIVLTGGYDPCIGVEGYDHTFHLPCMLEKENESDDNRHFRRWMEIHTPETQVKWWESAICDGLSDLWIFGAPFADGDVLHLASQEWEGITLPETFWQVESDFIEPRTFTPTPDDI